MSRTSWLEVRPSKLPAIVTLFWTIKIVTTGMGEAASDFLVRTLGNVPAVSLGALVFAAALVSQLRSQRFSKWIYWISVAMVSIFGTMAADIVHIGFGVPYMVSTVVFTVLLCATFFIWWKLEGTVAISSINTGRREFLYWLTVLTTFALGTAAGDMTARTLNLGYLNSGFLFAGVFAIPLFAYTLKVRGRAMWFWLAYIATRPFGASFADWVGADVAKGGLGFGFGNITVVLTLALVGLVLSSANHPASK